MALTAVKWTVEDYHRLIAVGILAGRPVELLKEEIVEMAPEGEPHAYAEVIVHCPLRCINFYLFELRH